MLHVRSGQAVILRGDGAGERHRRRHPPANRTVGLSGGSFAAYDRLRAGTSARNGTVPPAFPSIELASVYVQMGCFQEAVDVGREAERLVKAHDGEDFVRMELSRVLWGILADAHEGLGQIDECMKYHTHVYEHGLKRGWPLTDATSYYCRRARVTRFVGDDAMAEEALEKVLDRYKASFNEPLPVLTYGVGDKNTLAALQVLAEIKRQGGKMQEARLLEQDVEETEAITQSIADAAMEELREELRADMQRSGAVASAEEAAAGGERQQRQDEGKTRERKKNITRKQQKRKAAQRRKAEVARAAGAGAGAAAAAAAVGNGEETEEEE